MTPVTGRAGVDGKQSLGAAIVEVVERAPQGLTVAEVHDSLSGTQFRCLSHSLFVVAADNRGELLGSIAALRAEVEARSNGSFAGWAEEVDLAQPGHFRVALVATDREDLLHKLDTTAKRIARPGCDRLRLHTGMYFGHGRAPGRVALLFPGQGAQHGRMLSELCVLRSTTRAWFAALDGAYAGHGVEEPSRLLYARDVDRGDLFSLDRGAQLCMVASLAMHEILVEWGVKAAAIVGHSLGERAALVAAGAFATPDLDALAESFYQGSRVLQQLDAPAQPEAVCAVSNADRSRLDELLGRWQGELFLTMDNCPNQIVIAGLERAVAHAATSLSDAGASIIPLPFPRAYHTPLFAAAARALRGHYVAQPAGLRRTPVVSCHTCRYFPDDHAELCDWTANQWAAPVRFREVVGKLFDQGIGVFVEVGPDDTLSGFVHDTLRRKPHLAVSASSRGRGDLLQLQHLAAELYACGVLDSTQPFEWLRGLERGEEWCVPARGTAAESAREIDSRSDHQLCEAHEALVRATRQSMQRVALAAGLPRRRGTEPSATTPRRLGLLRRSRTLDDTPAQSRAELVLKVQDIPALRDHSFGRMVSARSPELLALPVLSFTTSLEVLAEAACCASSGVVVGFEDVVAHRWLGLDGGRLDAIVEVESDGMTPTEKKQIAARLVEVSGCGELLAFEGRAQLAERYPRARHFEGAAPVDAGSPSLSIATFYRELAFHGPAFQTLQQVRSVGPDSIDALLVATELPGLSRGELWLDPALLDATGQLVAFWLAENGQRDFGIYPFQADRIELFAPPPAAGSVVRAAGRIDGHHGGVTSADFALLDGDGRLLTRVTGLRQRKMSLPTPLASALVKHSAGVWLSEASAGQRQVSVDLGDWTLLEGGGAIFVRALAHLALDRAERADWKRAAEPAEAWRDLLARILCKELARLVLPDRGVDVAWADVRAVRRTTLGWEAHSPQLEAAIVIRVDQRGDTMTARIAGPTSGVGEGVAMLADSLEKDDQVGG